MVNKPGIYEMEEWNGQIPLSGFLAEWLPPKIQFLHAQEDVNEIETYHFTVVGNMWDVELRTGFKLHKGFKTRESAEAFFDAFVAKYPNSRIYLKENTIITLKKYY